MLRVPAPVPVIQRAHSLLPAQPQNHKWEHRARDPPAFNLTNTASACLDRTQHGNRTTSLATTKGRGVVDSSSGRGESSTSFRPVLPWDENVPAYDGTMSFNPKTYRALKPLNSFEIQPDSAIIVMFTVGTFPYSSIANAITTDGLNTSLSLNIQLVITLANPSHPKDIKDNALECPIGVEQEVAGTVHDGEDSNDSFSDDGILV
ncbi:hypothetical protein LshimejAT787_1300970 [Lyophyllum shimeji]|uniref:Uncharacterized protein n=1 Tax=Lyophyllum shimeji TaxID=47721 RepID=A0A9P3UUI6_LYOSH|nr:hypothetical protein LshimejAT787_1300970 [Lyophyllum shimeji]